MKKSQIYKNLFWCILVTSVFSFFTACSSDDEEAAAEGITSEVLCGYSDSGDQQLEYNNMDPESGTNTPINESLAYNFSWTCSGSDRTLSGNGVPNHAVTDGEFASQISAQEVSFTFPLSPELADAETQQKEPGYALNSVRFDPATNGGCPGDASDDGSAAVASDCNPGNGAQEYEWNMVALPSDPDTWQFGFGVDTSNAHVQPGGIYHYHGLPTELIAKLNTNSASSMTLIGWAKDGFPIYTQYGYQTVSDATSGVKAIQSSWQVKSSADADRPSTDNFAMGHFTQDWEYVAGSGDLDECNGRTGVTPEFPEGIYHYYMTETFPHIQRCTKGVVSGGGGPGGGGPGGGGPGGGGPGGGGPPPE